MNTSRNTIRIFATAVAALITLAAYSNMAFADSMAVKLGGAQEVPPVDTKATGSATIKVGTDMSVSGNVTTTGVVGTMAHIHQGAAGKNGPVIIPFTKADGGNWSLPADAKLTDAQYQAYKAGDLYINVHSAEHPGGEIRAQLKP